MTPGSDPSDRVARLRREPPRFRTVSVRAVEPVTPHLLRVTLTGSGLEVLAIAEPAASVRVLLPEAGAGLVMPAWNGNEFLLPDGTRPTIRTLTPWRSGLEPPTLEVGIVVHDGGAASRWATDAKPGDEVAFSGPGRGYTVDLRATSYLLAGDETAIPAITQLLEAVARTATVQVRLEIAHPDARLALPDHPGAVVSWCEQSPGAKPGTALIAAVEGAELDPAGRIWVAGEAAAMQRIRRHLFDVRGIPRDRTSVRGYWKHGRRADAAGD